MHTRIRALAVTRESAVSRNTLVSSKKNKKICLISKKDLNLHPNLNYVDDEDHITRNRRIDF